MTAKITPCRDYALLAQLHATSFAPGWTADEIAAFLTPPSALALVAGESEAAGFVLGWSAGDEAEILTLAVAPGARRRGLARALVEAASDAFARAGAEALYLEVRADNDAARALYEALGFARVSVRKGYYADSRGPIDGLVLRRNLKNPPG